MLLLSLIGEQPIPNLLPVRYLQPDETLLVYTSKTREVASRLRRLISGGSGDGSIEYNLDNDLQTEPFAFEDILAQLRKRLAGRREVVFNLTGGTKMMALAAYALAAARSAPFVYLDSESGKSDLLFFRFEKGLPTLESRQTLPSNLITAADYLNAHLPGFVVEGYHRDESGELSSGGRLEKAVCEALLPHLDEALAGVRPQGVDNQIEIDLVLRLGNQVGIAEIKKGDDFIQRGVGQLKIAGGHTYLGTYTTHFMVVAARRLKNGARTLARRRGVELIQLMEYTDGDPLSPDDTARLVGVIHSKLKR